MLAQDALADGAEAFDGSLGAQVAQVRLELHPNRAEVLEGMAELKLLALCVHHGALVRRADPGPPDLQPAVVARMSRYRVEPITLPFLRSKIAKGFRVPPGRLPAT